MKTQRKQKPLSPARKQRVRESCKEIDEAFDDAFWKADSQVRLHDLESKVAKLSCHVQVLNDVVCRMKFASSKPVRTANNKKARAGSGK